MAAIYRGKVGGILQTGSLIVSYILPIKYKVSNSVLQIQTPTTYKTPKHSNFNPIKKFRKVPSCFSAPINRDVFEEFEQQQMNSENVGRVEGFHTFYKL